MSRLACAALAALLAVPAAAQSLVTGRVEYVDKAWDYNGWTGADPVLPVRRADVHVLDGANSAILASGSTAQDGSFALSVNLGAVTSIIVRADCDTNLDGTFQRIRVTTETNVEYVVQSPVIPVPVALPTLDIGTLTALAITDGNAEANPFNMLDLGVTGAEYLASPSVGAPPSSQTIRFYWPGGSGSFASGSEVHLADDDGYDDAVGLHELGHVVHNLYSDSDNPGGSHTFGDSDQDPQLSFGEGYATAFAGMVMEWSGREAIYLDAGGASQSGGVQLRARLETTQPYAQDSWGEADELSVACTLFDLCDTELSVDASPGVDDDLMVAGLVIDGVAPSVAWWEAFVGPLDAAPHVGIDDAWDGWLAAHPGDPHLEELASVFDLRRLRCWSDAQEPDNDMASAAPLTPVKTGGWLTDRWLYYSSADPPAPGSPDVDWYSVALVQGDVVTISTRYPGNAGDADTECDTLIDLFTPMASMAATADDGGAGRNAAVSNFAVPVGGTWRFSVRSADTSRRYGRYEVRVLYVSQNHPPVIADGPHATPDTIASDDTTVLDVTATDEDVGQTLSYAWTPLDGGTILGSGAAVSFAPPAVTVPTVVRVRVVVSDSLGAPSLPAEVQVNVVPASGPCISAPGVVSGGVPKPGLLGPPTLAAVNLPALPSTNFALHATGCLPSHACTLIFGFGLISAPFDGGHLYPTPDLLLTLATNPQGEVLLPLVLGSDPLMCGLTFHVQLMVPGDPGAAGGKHTAQTNYLSLTFGS